MGFFDSIIKDITSGELDKKLAKLADGVEKFSNKMDGTAKTMVEKSENLSKKADETSTKAFKTIEKAAD